MMDLECLMFEVHHSG
jgi:hypothetical protein